MPSFEEALFLLSELPVLAGCCHADGGGLIAPFMFKFVVVVGVEDLIEIEMAKWSSPISFAVIEKAIEVQILFILSHDFIELFS